MRRKNSLPFFPQVKCMVFHRVDIIQGTKISKFYYLTGHWLTAFVDMGSVDVKGLRLGVSLVQS
jgi:hypothetical protein